MGNRGIVGGVKTAWTVLKVYEGVSVHMPSGTVDTCLPGGWTIQNFLTKNHHHKTKQFNEKHKL